MTSRYAEVHIKAQAMRRKLTEQSRELALERTRRMLWGMQEEHEDSPRIVKYEPPLRVIEYEN